MTKTHAASTRTDAGTMCAAPGPVAPDYEVTCKSCCRKIELAVAAGLR